MCSPDPTRSSGGEVNIKEIIDDAIENSQDVVGEPDFFIGSEGLAYGFDEVDWRRQEKFIATFTPEHVRLMETVVEAADNALCAELFAYRSAHSDE
jgi:hypothetical protein